MSLRLLRLFLAFVAFGLLCTHMFKLAFIAFLFTIVGFLCIVFLLSFARHAIQPQSSDQQAARCSVRCNNPS